MSDFANVLPWVQASVRRGAEVPAEHAAALLAELDRRANEITELGGKAVEQFREVERLRVRVDQLRGRLDESDALVLRIEAERDALTAALDEQVA